MLISRVERSLEEISACLLFVREIKKEEVMRIMVTAKSSLKNSGVRRGRACSMSTGNPVEDMAISSQTATAVTPNRASRTPTAQPIAIPDSGSRRRYGSPRSVQSGSPRSHSYTSSKSSPNRASPSTNGLFYAGAKFSEAPAAASLPKPPPHWTTTNATYHKEQFQEISNQLKMLLNIKA